MTTRDSWLRRWIDANLVSIGIVMLSAGLGFNVLTSVYNAIGPDPDGPSWAIAMMLIFAAPLVRTFVYLGSFLVGAGVLLRNWRVILVGFENTPVGDLVVDGPDDSHTVWIGKRYSNAFDAEASSGALAKRLSAQK